MVTPQSDGPVSAPGRRPVGRLALAGAGILVAAAALGAGLFWAYYGRPRPQSEPAPVGDPRLDYAGPFRNVAPSVRYVAEARCADCHADIARTFADHPMGRSILPVARGAAPPEDAGHGNPFDALGSRFQVVREGDRVLHRRSRVGATGQPVAELDFPVQYVIGSGAHGHSYLTDRDGYLFETPVSWYAQKRMWALSPGFGPGYLTGRAVPPGCLFCHANRADGVAGSVNHYAEPIFDGPAAIGCQRCHGPGELHVAAREAGEPVAGEEDTTIVNPARLEPDLREAVCEQCHLEGVVRVVRRGRGLYDFRPGLPLERFWSAFVGAPSAGETRSAVGHVEQMAESGCFRGGSGPGRLGCVSCHDPHRAVPPAERVAWYRGRCLKCHEQHGCSLPRAERLRRSPEDSCIDCHMPRYGAADIPHTASTDHRIPRRADAAGHAKPRPPEDGIPVVSFYRGREGAGGPEDERDLGVALVELALTGTARDGRALGRAADLLATACRRDPGDLDAVEARGHALALQGHWAEALRAFEAVLARAPEWEMALVGAGTAAEALSKPEEALGYWRRAVAVGPWAPDYRRRLALLLIDREAWDEAGTQCDAWVRLDPFSTEARAARIRCLLAAGRKEEARAEFARVEALAPENLPELEARFRKKLK
jgi:hypothetical protein